jgi:hypothetical protein
MRSHGSTAHARARKLPKACPLLSCLCSEVDPSNLQVDPSLLQCLICTEYALKCLEVWMRVASSMQELCRLPFPWADEVTASSQSESAVCNLFVSAGIHEIGLWQRECQCQSRGGWGQYAPIFPASISEVQTIRDLAEMAGLPRRHVPCLNAKVQTALIILARLC